MSGSEPLALGDDVVINTHDTWGGNDMQGMTGRIEAVQEFPSEQQDATGCAAIYDVRVPGFAPRPLHAEEVALLSPARNGDYRHPCCCCSAPLAYQTRYYPPKGLRTCPTCVAAGCPDGYWSQPPDLEPPCGQWTRNTGQGALFDVAGVA